MGHHHNHHHTHGQHDDSTSNIGWAFFLNLIFTILEFIGGTLTNSVAILSDAIHDLGDTIAIGLGYFFEKYSNKKENNTYTYGYRRYSTLAAIINVIVLTTGSIIMLIKSIPRIFAPEEVDAKGMVVFGILGVLVNGAAVIKLMKNKNSANQRVMMLHMLEDTLGWIAVLIGAIVIYFFNWPIIDPILSTGIAIYILYNAVKNLFKILPIFLQATPSNIDPNKIKERIKSLKGVFNIHDLHLWSLDGEFNIMSLHLVLDHNVNKNQAAHIKKEIRNIIQKDEIRHITIEIEWEDENCDLLKD
ncbi:cation diffusion facilitator family transporter [Flammeovirga pacifica]|uniref:Cation transporter n=1 Tax=Flammeovirga pacifica TaxID=915059 RepID=A0A1S1YYA7_FLAPC|nr:cation diffusion facilitator family transporter [Flammeovirga pacifica]OHX65913.1 cation transporter [Flammeovirga pacifica]